MWLWVANYIWTLSRGPTMQEAEARNEQNSTISCSKKNVDFFMLEIHREGLILVVLYPWTDEHNSGGLGSNIRPSAAGVRMRMCSCRAREKNEISGERNRWNPPPLSEMRATSIFLHRLPRAPGAGGARMWKKHWIASAHCCGWSTLLVITTYEQL
jgi:hypothetical protein